MNKPADLVEVLPAKSCGKQHQMMASNISLAFFMSGLHNIHGILLLPHCTSVRSQHYTDNLISTRTCSCVCICRIALCPFMYSAVMWTCSCLVDVMWTCDEVGWPFGLQERDVSPFVPKACCAFCRLPVCY